MKNSDQLFASSFTKVSDFIFDEKVAAVFENMANRSIPGYGVILSMIGVITREFAQDSSNLYDLGSSLGAVTLAMRNNLQDKKCKIIAIDNSLAMVERSKQFIDADESSAPVEVFCEDIQKSKIENASIVALNFTLQFLDPLSRLPLLKKIYNNLLPGGVLLLSEKLSFEENEEQEIQDRLYYAFKRAHGYSELEVSQKRTALEKVMLTDSLSVHQSRLKEAGFSNSWLWFQSFNFVSILAVK